MQPLSPSLGWSQYNSKEKLGRPDLLWKDWELQVAGACLPKLPLLFRLKLQTFFSLQKLSHINLWFCAQSGIFITTEILRHAVTVPVLESLPDLSHAGIIFEEKA